MTPEHYLEEDSEKPFFCANFLDGGNRALVVGFLGDTNFEASETLFLKAFQSLKNCLY